MNGYSIFPLGDSAITIDLGNCIEEHFNIKTIAIHDWLQARSIPGLLDIISAYSSVTLFYDPAGVIPGDLNNPEGVGGTGRPDGMLPGVAGAAYRWMETLLQRAWDEAGEGARGVDGLGRVAPDGVERVIPVCYEGEYAPDLSTVAAQKGLSPTEVVALHVAAVYRVYMIGFLPGFPYLGRLDPRLDTPRKAQPEAVRAGGVGIAGMQTGIYPLNSPGGWWIIGRTPVRLFDAKADPPVGLRAGDRVRFQPISAAEFRHLTG